MCFLVYFSSTTKRGGRSLLHHLSLNLLWWFVFSIALFLLVYRGILLYCIEDPRHKVCETAHFESHIVPFSYKHVLPRIEVGQEWAYYVRKEVNDKGYI